MPLVPSQKLRQWVTVRDPGANLGDGPALGDPWRLRCAVDYGQTLTRDANGDEVTGRAAILCRPGRVPKSGAQVDVDGDVMTVLQVQPIYTPGGATAGYTLQVG